MWKRLHNTSPVMFGEEKNRTPLKHIHRLYKIMTTFAQVRSRRLCHSLCKKRLQILLLSWSLPKMTWRSLCRSLVKWFRRTRSEHFDPWPPDYPCSQHMLQKKKRKKPPCSHLLLTFPCQHFNFAFSGMFVMTLCLFKHLERRSNEVSEQWQRGEKRHGEKKSGIIWGNPERPAPQPLMETRWRRMGGWGAHVFLWNPLLGPPQTPPPQHHAECEQAGFRMYKCFITWIHDRGQLVRRPHCFSSLFPARILPSIEQRREKNPPFCLWSSPSFDEKLQSVFMECGETLPHRGKSDQAWPRCNQSRVIKVTTELISVRIACRKTQVILAREE